MMNCPQVRELLDAYVDLELDVAHCVEMEEHIRQCPDCSKLDEGIRALKVTISSHATYYRAPQHVSDVHEAITISSKAGNHRAIGKVPLTLAASLLIGVIGFFAGMLTQSRSGEQKAVDLVVAAHVRSLLVEHAVDVASSDRHTVKPWFQGKLDYAPLVINLSDQGFDLHGGRLDYLIDRPVAAIVYYRRSHAINVFTWHVPTDKASAIHRISTQGYHLRNWQQQGMNYWAISDLNDNELDQFIELLREDSPQPAQKL